MTITLDIRPEVQAELARQAAASGCALETHAARLLEEAAHVPGADTRLTAAAEAHSAKGQTGQLLIDALADIRGLLTDEEVDRMFARNPSTARPIDFS
jgi:hypothetical protein